METLSTHFYYIRKYINILNEEKTTSRFQKFFQILLGIMHIAYWLPINWFLYIKLKIYKRLNKINQPIIHLYALCWNEEKILPFVLDYYSQFVDKIFIYDNYSTDSSNAILNQNERVKVINFKSDHSINDFIYIDIKNSCWKQSRGKADYVIVCDTDELLYHPDMKTFLENSMNQKLSFFKPIGYNMYSEEFPIYNSSQLITDQIKTGVYDSNYCKSIMFDPHRIVEINYTVGAHFCYPWGIVRQDNNTDLLLLHYKNLSVDYVLNRIKTYRSRISEINIEKKYGAHYLNEDEKITAEIKLGITESKRII